MDAAWIVAATEASNEGDWSRWLEAVDADVVHHIPSLGITWRGRDELLRGVEDLRSRAGVAQHVETVSEHGPFVILTVRSTSRHWPQGTETVQVYRTAGDRIVEGWVITQPLPTTAGDA